MLLNLPGRPGEWDGSTTDLTLRPRTYTCLTLCLHFKNLITINNDRPPYTFTLCTPLGQRLCRQVRLPSIKL
jgi:hypothetical protein